MTKASLSIAVTADPTLPVPPRLYGGIERVIHLLVNGLSARGHEVVLFAHPDSVVSCELVPYPGVSHSRLDTIRNATAIATRVLTGQFDIVHSFGRLACLAPLAASSVPKLMSYQRPITPGRIRWARRLLGPSLEFTACSRHMIADVEDLAPWHVIYNGVSLDAYTFVDRVADDAPLVFLGRLDPEKGAHLAIEAARRAGRKLLIAGNVFPKQQAYFDQQIRPFVDHDTVEYVGPVDDLAKDRLLGRAAALLMPILWDEPFGIVMAEALACGTPVIGFNRGSVPEIVTDGVTGFLASNVDDLVEGVAHIDRVSRQACRTAAETRFSDDVIVREYESRYRANAQISQPTAANA